MQTSFDAVRDAQADAERAQRREQFLERTRTGKGLDLDAALAARDAWTH